MRTAVPIERRHTDQGGDLLAVQRAQFRQIREQCQRHLRSHSGYAAQQVVLLTPYRTVLYPRRRSVSRSSSSCCCLVIWASKRGGLLEWRGQGGSSQRPRCPTPAACAPALPRVPEYRHPSDGSPVVLLHRSAPAHVHPAGQSSPTARWTWRSRAPGGD